MDKVKAFLEKYVQWVALGVGVLFLGWMAYSYVVQTPVVVPVGGQQLAPSKVDPAVAADPDVMRLKKEVSGTGIDTGIVPPEVPKATEALVKTFFQPIPGVDLPQPGTPKSVSPTVVTTGPVTPGQLALAKVPAAAPVGVSNGRGVYQWTPLVPPPPPVDPSSFPGGVAPPVVTPPPPQPVWRDLDWSSQLFEVSLAALDKSFRDAGLNPAVPIQYKTGFLAVELHRQEKLPGGEWGPTAVVPVLPAYQAVIPPLPKPTATDQEKFLFVQALAPNLTYLLQPAFPQKLAGADWVNPGTPPPGAVGPAGGVAGEGRPFPPGGAVFQPPVALVPQGGEGSGTGSPMAPGTIPGTGSPDGTFLTTDALVPAQQAGQPDVKVQILTHDITAQPNKTYRYAVKYHVRNPLWGTGGGLSAAVAGPLALASPDSAWTKEVTIAPRVEFFASKVRPRGTTQVQDEVDMEVYVDQNGQWKQLKPGAAATTFSPGDPIAQSAAGAQAPGWNSGWSVVDVRRDPRNRTKLFLIVADANGRVERRDADTDQVSDRLRELRTLVGGPGAPGTPGAPVGGGPGSETPQPPRGGRPSL